MRNYGICYDTGTAVGGSSTRASFDSGVARRELEIIASDLHASAVRVYGDDPGRLAVAREHTLGGARAVVLAVPRRPGGGRAGRIFLRLRPPRRRTTAPRPAAGWCSCSAANMSLSCPGFVPCDGLVGRMATVADPATWSTPERHAGDGARPGPRPGRAPGDRRRPGQLPRRGRPRSLAALACGPRCRVRRVRCHAAWVGDAARSACRVPALTWACVAAGVRARVRGAPGGRNISSDASSSSSLTCRRGRISPRRAVIVHPERRCPRGCCVAAIVITSFAAEGGIGARGLLRAAAPARGGDAVASAGPARPGSLWSCWRWSSRTCSSRSGVAAKRSPQNGQVGVSVLGMSASFDPMSSRRGAAWVSCVWSSDGGGRDTVTLGLQVLAVAGDAEGGLLSGSG
jgi:hypothetical protein